MYINVYYNEINQFKIKLRIGYSNRLGAMHSIEWFSIHPPLPPPLLLCPPITSQGSGARVGPVTPNGGSDESDGLETEELIQLQILSFCFSTKVICNLWNNTVQGPPMVWEQPTRSDTYLKPEPGLFQSNLNLSLVAFFTSFKGIYTALQINIDLRRFMGEGTLNYSSWSKPVGLFV